MRNKKKTNLQLIYFILFFLNKSNKVKGISFSQTIHQTGTQFLICRPQHFSRWPLLDIHRESLLPRSLNTSEL